MMLHTPHHAQALFANEAALKTLTMGITDCLAESRRTYWDVALEVTA